MSEEQNVEPPNEAVSFPVETQNYAPLLKKRKDSDNYVPKRKRDLGDVSDENIEESENNEGTENNEESDSYRDPESEDEDVEESPLTLFT